MLSGLPFNLKPIIKLIGSSSVEERTAENVNFAGNFQWLGENQSVLKILRK